MDWVGLIRHGLTLGAGAIGYDAAANGDTVTTIAAGLVAIGTVIWSIVKGKFFDRAGA